MPSRLLDCRVGRNLESKGLTGGAEVIFGRGITADKVIELCAHLKGRGAFVG